MSYFSRTPKISSQSITTRTKGVPKSPRHHKGRAFWLTSVPSKAVTVYPKSDPITGWTVNSLRTGLICTKIGMSTDWDEWGVMRPLTFLKVEDNHVVEIKTEEKHGYNALKIGAGFIKTKNMNRSQMGTCAVANVPPKRWFVEFRVTPDAMIPVGTRLTCMHFQPGQSVDVMGISKGKGFQGVMKRWGFSGGAASHGNSLAHRTLGSTGQRQDPGRVFPGKKMPGRMGNAKKWVRALKVFGVYPEKNAISVIGGVPGAKTKMVKVKDNWGYKWLKPPPFPTYLGPKPKEEALFGYTREKNPWWDEDKLDSLQHVQALYEGYKKFMQDNPPPPNDEFFRRLNRKDSSPNYMGLRGSGNSIDDKILESGKQILEKKQQEEQRRAQEATERAKLKALKAKEKQEKKALGQAQQ